MQRTYRVKAVDGQFVQSDQIFTTRFFGVAVIGYQVADVVVRRHIGQNFKIFVIPLGNAGVYIDRSINNTILAVELVVQRAKTYFQATMQSVVKCNNRNAEFIFLFEFFGFDGRHDFIKVINPSMRIQFTCYDDVFTRTVNINTVRRLGFGNQIKQTVLNGFFNGNNRHSINFLLTDFTFLQ